MRYIRRVARRNLACCAYEEAIHGYLKGENTEKPLAPEGSLTEITSS